MKKFLLSVITFIVIIGVLSFLIGSIEISDRYIKYKTLGTSYEKISWNLDLIKNHPEKIEGSVVFFGPSSIQGDICDSTLNAHGIKALNMGVNHSGNEVELFFIKKVASYKPKKVYTHLSKDKYYYLHPMTPMLYTPLELLSSGQTINVTFAEFLLDRAAFVLDYLVWKITNDKVPDATSHTYGVRYEMNKYTEENYNAISKNELQQIFENTNLVSNDFLLESEKSSGGAATKIKRLIRLLRYEAKNTNFLFNAGGQQEFVMQSFALGASHGIEVSELYVPSITDTKVDQNFNGKFFAPRKTLSVTSMKNFSFLDSAEYWSDMNHLSKKGGITFTEQLINEGVIK